MEKLELTFYGRLPGINELVGTNRQNRYAGAKMKRDTQDEIEAVLFPQCVGKKFSAHVTVEVRFYESDYRRDDDNVFGGLKFILDALQELKVIENDSPRCVHVLPERFTESPERVEIDIYEDGVEIGKRRKKRKNQ